MYPLIPHPHKLLDRIESGSGNSKSISAIGEQRSSFVKLGPGKVLSKLFRRRYILISRYNIITFLPWNENRPVENRASLYSLSTCIFYPISDKQKGIPTNALVKTFISLSDK